MFCTTPYSFGTLLKQWRGNLSQLFIGNYIGRSDKRISAFECRRALPKNEVTVHLLGDALGIRDDATKMYRLIQAYHCDIRKRDDLQCYCYPSASEITPRYQVTQERRD